MIIIKCDWCKKEYQTYRAWLKYSRHFCSRRCKYIWNTTQKGFWKGKKMPFYIRPNRKIVGKKNPNWKGGRRMDKTGYILIYFPNHPFSDGDGYIREHRLIMEKKIGRYLKPEEVIHHINHIRNDNRLKNLILIEDKVKHQKLHYHHGDSKHLKHYSPKP